jgi:hypothetical protein
MNQMILKVWLTTKIERLQDALDLLQFSNEPTQKINEKTQNLTGKLEILKEFYEDFNLESVDTEELVYHNNF